MAKKCIAIKADGSTCKNNAKNGQEYCHHHEPKRLQEEAKLGTRFFVVGCTLLIAALGIGFWAFSLSCLSPHHMIILQWLLPLASGFAIWSFSGSASVQARGVIPGIVIIATSSFGVYLITAYFLIPKYNINFNCDNNTFRIVMIIEELDGTLADKGHLRLYYGDSIRNEPINQKGQVVFSDLPYKFKNEKCRIKLMSGKYQLSDKNESYSLSKSPIIINVIKTKSHLKGFNQGKAKQIIHVLNPINRNLSLYCTCKAKQTFCFKTEVSCKNIMTKNICIPAYKSKIAFNILDKSKWEKYREGWVVSNKCLINFR